MGNTVRFIDLTLRDGQQSLAATRMTMSQALSVLKIIDDAGYAAIELWGGAVPDSCVRYLNEDPWERLDAYTATLDNKTEIRVLLRGQNLFAYQPYPDDLVIAFVKEAIRSGAGIVRMFDALNDIRNLQISLLAAKAYGSKAETAISYTVSPLHTTEYFVDLALALQEEGADQIAIKDMAGLLDPLEAPILFGQLKQSLSVPLIFHSHTTTGVATLNAVIAMQYGIDYIDTAITPFAGGASHPPIEVLIVFAEALGLDHGLDKKRILKAQKKLFGIFKALRDVIPVYGQYYRPVAYEDIDRRAIDRILTLLAQGGTQAIKESLSLMRTLLIGLGYPPYNDEILTSQVPGGMLTNLQSQLKQMGKLDLLDPIMEEIPSVRQDVGYVPLVTPTSQIVGSQAAFNVMFGRYTIVSDEFKMLLRGEFGRTPAPPNPDIVKKVLSPDDKRLIYRPASYLLPVLEDTYDFPFIKTHRDLLLHLMLKQPADDFLQRKYRISVK
ncbi:MAG: oxaloacetate decarboxylase subunit alpha [Anaerolineae bacterium]|nr:oxaloacetate decarboxylase subunit alpha [Anaerolineae bacterium]